MAKYYLYVGTEAYASYAYDSGNYTGVSAGCQRTAVEWLRVENEPLKEVLNTGVFYGTLVKDIGPFGSYQEAKKAAQKLLAEIRQREKEQQEKRSARKARLLEVLGKK